MSDAKERRIKHKVSIERTDRTFVTLFNIAKDAMLRGRQAARHYDWITVNIFCAFALEAYLNHLLAEKLGTVDLKTDRLRPEEKLKRVVSLLKFQPEFSSPPFHTFNQIFRFRNWIAHGKTYKWTINDQTRYLFKHEKPKSRPPKWEQFCKHAVSWRFLDHTEQMIRELNEKAGDKLDPFIISSEEGQKWTPEN